MKTRLTFHSRLRLSAYLAVLVATAHFIACAMGAPTAAQQSYLKASNTGTNDNFGYSVAVSGDVIVVGVPVEDSNARGVNGNQSNNSTHDSGAAYVFTGLALGPTLALAPDGSGGYFIRFTPIPDLACRWQRAAAVSDPWDTLFTPTTPTRGVIEFHDTDPPSAQAFYRTVQP